MCYNTTRIMILCYNNPFGCPLGSLWTSWATCGSPLGLSWCVCWNSLKIDHYLPLKCAKSIVNTSKIKPPGILHRIFQDHRIYQKWCQEVLLRPHLHTRRGPGGRELNSIKRWEIYGLGILRGARLGIGNKALDLRL